MSVRSEPLQSTGAGAARLRGFCARASTMATAFSLILTMLISTLVMDQIGLANYATSGGTILEKVHPGTWMAFLALALKLGADSHPVRALHRQMSRAPQLLFYLLAVVAAGAHSVMVSKSPITPLIDTFLAPLAYFLLLEDLDEPTSRRLAWLVGAFLAANALIGLAEFVTGWRLITFNLPANVTDDPRHAPGMVFDWRAALAKDGRPTAVLGHPLTNASITGVFVATLYARDAGWIAPGLRTPLLVLGTLALFAFGGRASLVVTLIVLAAMSVGWLFRAASGGVRISLRRWAYVLLAAPLLLACVQALIESGFFDRVLDRFSHDAGSAETRSKMFDLFQAFSLESLLLGPDQAVLATQQRVEGLEFGVESFVVGFILDYGLLITALLLAGLGAFIAAMLQVRGRGAIPGLTVFFVVAVTAESISAKTTMFGLVVSLILLFIRPERRQAWRISGETPGAPARLGSR